jgi:hypothetical protein
MLKFRDAREHECRLLERKSCADADARSDAEWQIVVAIDLLSSPIEWIAALSQDSGSPRAAH